MSFGDLTWTPAWLALILGSQPVWLLARLALTSLFWVAGLRQLTHWAAAVAETESLGLRPAGWATAAAIVFELGGSALIVLNLFVWVGTGGLALFTLATMMTAYRFWEKQGPERKILLVGFCEHIGLIGGMILAAIVASSR